MKLKYMAAIALVVSALSTNAAFAVKCEGSGKISENMAVKLSSGKYIWHVLRCNRGCYEINVGSNETNINGVANNCSDDLNGIWVVAGCDANETIRGEPGTVINKIIGQCSASSIDSFAVIKRGAMVCEATEESAGMMKNASSDQMSRNILGINADYPGPDHPCFRIKERSSRVKIVQRYSGSTEYKIGRAHV